MLNQMRLIILSLSFLSSIAFANLVRADIYAYVDENGVRHISNKPNDKRYKLVMRTPKYKKSDASKAQPSTAPSKSGPSDEIPKIGYSGWRLITPSKDGKRIRLWAGRRAAGVKGGKPFAINEVNRRRFSRAITQIAAQYRLDPNLLHAVISAESGFNPKAVSHAGAMGLMQLMPATAERFGVKNPYDPIANIRGGARYLRWLLGDV